MATSPIGLSWVNYTSASVREKDTEDTAIIKSHAMRVVHRQRQNGRRKRGSTGSSGRNLAFSRLCLDDPFLYQPETDWEGLAIFQFMDDFVYPEKPSVNNAFHYLSCLSGLYNLCADRSCLTEAVSAVALARFANQNRAAGLSFRARKAYTNALSLINEDMKDPILCKSDQVLATLCLLAKYEVVCGDPFQNESWQSHERGQAALINERGNQQLSTEVGVGLFRIVFIRQQMNGMARGRRPTMEMSATSWQLAFPTLRLRSLMRLTFEIARLPCATPMRLNDACPTGSKEAFRIAEDAVRLDAIMTSFITSLPTEMRYQKFPQHFDSPQDSDRIYLPKYINVFRDMQHASFWHTLWYSQIHVLQTLLYYSLNQLEFQPDELRSRLRETVDQVCESVSSTLGEYDCPKSPENSKSSGRAVAAHYLVWVLTAAKLVPDLPEPQRRWLSDRLHSMKLGHGMRQTLVFA